MFNFRQKTVQAVRRGHQCVSIKIQAFSHGLHLTVDLVKTQKRFLSSPGHARRVAPRTAVQMFASAASAACAADPCFQVQEGCKGANVWGSCKDKMGSSRYGLEGSRAVFRAYCTTVDINADVEKREMQNVRLDALGHMLARLLAYTAAISKSNNACAAPELMPANNTHASHAKAREGLVCKLQCLCITLSTPEAFG